jgi:hypothetical protein
MEPITWLQLGALLFGVAVLVLVVLLTLACRRAIKAAWTRASELLQHGSSLAGIQHQLVAEGFDPQDAAKVVRWLRQDRDRAVQEAFAAGAAELLDQGTSQEEAQQELVARGMNANAAAEMVHDEADRLWQRKHPLLGGLWGVGLGLAVVAVGIGITAGFVYFGVIHRHSSLKTIMLGPTIAVFGLVFVLAALGRMIFILTRSVPHQLNNRTSPNRPMNAKLGSKPDGN